MDKRKRARLIRFIGIVCWFMALFMLFDSAQEKKAAKEAEEAAKQTVITVNQIEENNEKTEVESTVVFPEE